MASMAAFLHNKAEFSQHFLQWREYTQGFYLSIHALFAAAVLSD